MAIAAYNNFMECDLLNNKRNVVRYLFHIMLFVNVFFVLFPAWRKSPLWLFFTNVDDYFSKWMSLLLLINLFFSFVIILIDRRWYSKYISFSLVFLWVTFVLSIVINGFESGILAMIGIPIMYFVLFVQLDRYSFSKSFFVFLLFVFSFWSILPVLLILVGDPETKIALFTSVKDTFSTFGGFALHRNFYGFYAGLTIIMFLISSIRIPIKVCVIPIICVGILLSGSRATLLTVFVSIVFYMLMTNKGIGYLKIIIIGGIFALLIYFALTLDIRSGNGLEDDGRESLAEGFWNIIQDNIFFGEGHPVLFYSKSYPIGSPAHNIVLQVWADYGLFALLFYLFFLFLNFFFANIYKRVILLYLCLFSIFQPYFCLSMPNEFLCISLFVASVLNSNNSEKNCYTKS